MSGPAASDSVRAARAVSERGREIAHERAAVEEVRNRLRADEQGLLADLEALRVQKSEIEAELGKARDRLASLDAAVLAARYEAAAKERELAHARDGLEHEGREAARMEAEIAQYRKQISIAKERLGELTADVVRIRHKMRRASGDGS